ncbi:uncharacterized protein MAM_08318 [Metarhizium album ARSEF 1941]|uniref:Lysozyme-like domain protein n=1 Tax=Metarhizium album (strain ARSEF 1941) TaxID=1081103 RepID=A0A0B2WJI1_METAS|nr:uncharacterized protein MAM_08318 [Metarhizium album ARSEF 1941]KHN93839.1 hypothetical protein MAM_08318 [Metarhizium album ARSEF 1941]
MKSTTPATLVGLVAAVAAYPASDRLWARACTPGALVCNGSTQFAICVGADATPQWMAVAAGTRCVCAGSECTLAAVSGGSSAGDAGQPGNASSPPAPSSAAQPTASTAPAANPAPSPGPSSPVSAPAPSSAAAAPAPSSAAAAPAPAPSGSSPAGPVVYKVFKGDGSTAAGWPSESTWADFETMWSSNLAVMSTSCAAWSQPNNSEKETADVKSAILSVSKAAGVDARFVLSVVMQESRGCVRVPTTEYSVRNPGLMQSHNGASSCFDVNPCPADKIVGMIQDGTDGTPDGDGLKQLLAKAGGGAAGYYKASRMYNSGSVAADGLLEAGVATHCYATDVANRLRGWATVGRTSCPFD